MTEPIFISREVALDIHHASLERHGGMDGLREPGLLDSALMQPEATYYYGQGDPAAIAAAYAFHIAQNQPFIDGNKRTAMGCALLFLKANGVDVERYDDSHLYRRHDRHRREAHRQGRARCAVSRPPRPVRAANHGEVAVAPVEGLERGRPARG